MIKVRGLSKSYGGVRALDRVDLAIAAGEVHAMVGENGAGKSTLNKILSGSLKPDEGEILLEGCPLSFGRVADAEAAGIAIVHQESTAFPHLDAVDNVFLMHERARLGGLWLDRPAMEGETRVLLESLGESFPIGRPLEELTLAQRQTVGIARSLHHKCRLLILDEPTASLSSRETDALFEVVRRLRSDGVSILYVSHRLEEVFELADRVSVLRDGRHVATLEVPKTSREELIGLMVGRAIEQIESRGSSADVPREASPLLSVRGLSKNGAFDEISFDVRCGEVVSLAGLVGAGRTELARVLFGLDAPDSGTIEVESRQTEICNPQSAIRHRLAYLPEDRQDEGLHLALSIRQNIAMAVLPRLSKFGFVNRREERNLSEAKVHDLGVRAPSDLAPVESLSGGNQQKVLFGKWLAAEPRVLVLDEPTRGVDVGAKAEIHCRIRELADNGAAVLAISSELPEALLLGDRVLVMRQGCLSGELSRDEATQEKILSLALPQKDRVEVAEKESRGWPREVGIAGLLVVLFLIVGLDNPAFLSVANLRDMLVRIAPAVIVSSGLTFVILAREIDISVGSLMGLCSTTLGIACATDRMGLPAAAGVPLCLGVGLFGGLINGLLVAFGRIPSIIVTLGMLTILSGATEILLGGKWITTMPPGIREFGTGSILGVPYSVLVASLVASIALWLSAKTPFGKRVYALGSNPKAAESVGLPKKRVQLAVFMLTGLLVGFAALFSATQLQVIESGFGKGFELTAVAAVVVGGTSIRGGRGSILGTLLGAALLGVVGTMLIFLRLGESSTYWERAIQGGLILAAVLVDHLSRRRKGAS